MQRRKVLHVIGGLQLGGAETLLYRLSSAPSDGFVHEVVCLGERAWYSGALEENGVAVHHLGMTSAASTARAVARLRSLLRTSRADVVHSWMYLANVLSSLAARGTSVPVVWSIHASTFEHLGLASRLCAHVGGRSARQLASFVVNCSGRSAERHASFGYGAVPNRVIHNGYDASAFFPDGDKRAAARAALGLEEGAFAVGSVSRWHSEKDVGCLIEAVALARSGCPDLKCLLIGPGLEPANLELAAAIRSRGIEADVIPLGSRTDVPHLLRALDLHVLSSRSEAFPNVVAESMLSGVPNVVTDVGDSALMVGETGWVVPPSRPELLSSAIASAFTEWSDHKQDWVTRQRSARTRIAEQFTFGRMVAAYEEVWASVLAS
jgi:glycosyltransferase involved in cell wall biosynthesis